jgi:hypothetical protein
VGEEELLLVDGGITLNTVTWTNPCVLHANGDKNHPVMVEAQRRVLE